MSMQGLWQDRAYFLLLRSKGRSGSRSSEEKLKQRRINVEAVEVEVERMRRSGGVVKYK